jgi:UPF0755 protein
MNGKRFVTGAAAAAALALLWINAAPSSSHEGVIPVPPGTGAGQVVQRLVSDGQLRSPRWFRFLLKATGADRRLKAGSYAVEKGDSAWALARRLAAGRSVAVRVTVPEGWTAEKIADRLGALGVCGRDAFLAAVSSASAEGFLFPDTYDFDAYMSADKVRDAMMARFAAAWREAVAASSGALVAVQTSTASPRGDRVRLAFGESGRPDGWWSCRAVVTLASIIEREGGRGEERRFVAAVYHNRLRKGMRLEADPTVQYALGRWKERLLFRDLEVNSPYNTYRRAGLPPGPIGNPGLEAIKAALAPAPVPYLYFVADEEGGHRFSAVYADHLKNVRDRNLRLHRRAS